MMNIINENVMKFSILKIEFFINDTKMLYFRSCI